MQTIITLIISILLMRIASEEIFDCTGYEEDSFHPMSNRNDCRFYWHCVHVDTVHMQAVKRACPPETEFDFRTSQCEWANSKTCQSRRQNEVLSTHPPMIMIEQLLENLMKIKHQVSTVNAIDKTTNPIIDSTSTRTTLTTRSSKRRVVIHRNNLTLNILTSAERRIRRFVIRGDHGLLIHCNEIRRRHLRDLIFRGSPTTTTTSKMPRNHSSKIFLSSDILSLTMFLIFTKIRD